MSFTDLFLKLVIADLCRFFQHSFEFCDLFIFCFYHLLGILSYILNWSGKVKLMIIFHLALNSNMFVLLSRESTIYWIIRHNASEINSSEEFLITFPFQFSDGFLQIFGFCSVVGFQILYLCILSVQNLYTKFGLNVLQLLFFYNTFCQGLNHSINRNRFYLISVNNTAIKWEHFNTFWTAESCFCWSRSFSSWNRASSIFVLIWIFYKVLEKFRQLL